MNIAECKEHFINFLYNRGVYKRKVNKDLYLTRCPYCGDSRSSFNTGHLYIKISPDTDARMVYYCQKCQEHGIVGKELTVLLDGNSELVEDVAYINSHGRSYGKSSSYSSGEEFIYVDRIIPDTINPSYEFKLAYVNRRLGVDVSSTEAIDKFKIILSIYDFLVVNRIDKLMFKPEVLNELERYYVGFLSTGNSHILLRDTRPDSKFPWVKYPITKESKRNKVFYTVASEVDIFVDEPVTINISEGVMDAIGIQSHFCGDEKTINMAACGRNYYGAIRYLLSKGLFGKTFTLNLYLDNDIQFGNGKEYEIPRELAIIIRSLYGDANTYKNLIGKDCGVTRDKIMLDRHKLY